MILLSRLRSWFTATLHGSRLETEMDAELRFHIETYAEDLVRSGVPREEAMRRARLEFGALERAKAECREARGIGTLEALVQDSRHGARLFRKSPGFTIVAVLTLALGIGASTAVFSVVNAILLKPLPYPDAERIVIPWLVAPPGVNIGAEFIPWGQIQFRLLTKEDHPFQHVGAYQNDSFNLTGSGEPALLDGFRTSAGFFPALGVSPILGRTYSTDEDQPGHEHVVVLSYRLWTERFGADRGLLGRAVNLNEIPYAVIGVMPADFAFPRAEEMPVSFNFPHSPQLWVPLAIPAVAPPGPSELAVIGRLKPGLAIAQAQAQMDVVTRHAEEVDPQWKGWFNTRVTPLAQQVAGDTQRPLLLILGSVGIVLLIACSNVANLLLARSIARKREFTLRAALGAARGRLIRQLMTESLLLAAIGGLLGMVLAEAGVHFVKTLGPANIPRLQDVSLDWRVLTFALGVSVLTGMFFGLVPAIAASRENVVESLKEGGQRSGGSPLLARLRSSLLVSQVALALVLVISAGLLIRTFYTLLEVDPGFRPSQVLTFELALPPLSYPDRDHLVALYTRTLEHLQSLPGVESVGLGETLPMGGEGESSVITIPDHPVAKDQERPFANYTIVSPGFFSAVGAPLLRGRGIALTDTVDSIPVAVINAAMARRFWPGEDAVGKRLGLGSPRFPIMTVVGIVADIKHFSMRENPEPEMYVPYTQKPWPSMRTMQFALRTKADPSSIATSVSDTIHSLDPGLPVAKVAPLQAFVDDSMTQPRFAVLLLSSFAALALLLATIGMFAVISYSVAQRTQEIGIRIALGAAHHDVFAIVLAQGARLVGLGISIGLVAAFALTRLMTSFLFGVRPTDPLTFAAVSLLLVGVTLLACYLPARRATRVDPLVALRYE
jgi:putative ABC transport system permease protein